MTPADLAIVARLTAQSAARRLRIASVHSDSLDRLSLQLAALFHVKWPDDFDSDDWVAQQCADLSDAEVEAVQYAVAECLHQLRVQEREGRAWEETARELNREVERVRA